MSYITEHNIGGKILYVQWPASETIIDIYGRHFSCKRWPDRLSDCRIDGKRVSPIVYRRTKDTKIARKK